MDESLKAEYERWIALAGPDDPYSGQFTLGIRDVLRAHFLIVDFFKDSERGIGGIGPRDLGLLHSAMSRQLAGLGSLQKWQDKFEVCATLFFGLIKDHPFHDANKRTAFLCALYHLERFGRCPTVTEKEFEDLTVDVAEQSLSKHARYSKFDGKGADSDVLFLADYMRKNTREVDKKKYVINYRELANILAKHGIVLENPLHNRIHVVRIGQTRRFGLFGPMVARKSRLGVIGFPGWTTEVSTADITRVRRMTGLDYKNNRVDSAEFYRGLDPLSSLITSYQAPLLRLAER